MIRRLSIALLFLATATSLLADPADVRRRTLIIKDGKILSNEGDLFRRVYLGFSPLDVSSELREFLGAPKDGGGVIVQSVKEGGPSAKAGLRVGDIVTSIDGKAVESAWTVGDTLDDKKAGDTVRIEIVRNKARQTLVATLEERELPMKLRALDLPGLEGMFGENGPLQNLPQWRARVEAREGCGELQTRIKDLESRLKDLEKKLQK
jgi:membrane-associated protease RseP (regulator of RpoE activity)